MVRQECVISKHGEASPKFTVPAEVSNCARRTAEGGCPHIGISLNRKHLASTVQRGLHRTGQHEDKQGILEVLNLEDHVLFAPSRLRDREGIFLYLYQRVSLSQSDLSSDITGLVIPGTTSDMN
jgi:hypothetical protein